MPGSDAPGAMYGVFPSAESLATLLARLQKAGVTDDRVEVLSTRPVPVPLPDRSGRLVRVAIAAGLAGLAFGILLTAGTALLYRIGTGGKPIVAYPVVGLISYETMMLAAIVATVVALAREVRRSRVRVSVPPLTGDQVALVVYLDGSGAETIRRLLEDAGAAEVRLGRAA
jgi:hypothetical protein